MHRIYVVRQQSNETNFLLAVLAILQSANTDSLWPWSFLNPYLQWHGCAMSQCRVSAWHVRRCLRTSSWKWKHGTSRSFMPSFFVLNLVTLPQQHMEYFSRPLEMMQCQEHKPFHWHKMFSEGRNLVEDEQRSGWPSATRAGETQHR